MVVKKNMKNNEDNLRRKGALSGERQGGDLSSAVQDDILLCCFDDFYEDQMLPFRLRLPHTFFALFLQYIE
jgi:hypothetical protein